jgi:hypothetical protein
MSTLITKPGKHGTLYLFRITYRDSGEAADFPFPWCTWAYSAEHAEEKFYDSDDDGWRISNINRARKAA